MCVCVSQEGPHRERGSAAERLMFHQDILWDSAATRGQGLNSGLSCASSFIAPISFVLFLYMTNYSFHLLNIADIIFNLLIVVTTINDTNAAILIVNRSNRLEYLLVPGMDYMIY